MAGRTGQAVAAQRAGQTAGVRLLRADLMPVLVSILSARFADHRTLPYSEFVAFVSEDLAELSDAGFALPQTPQQYVAGWIKDMFGSN